MTAHDQIRKMLDELMGTGRDGSVPENLVPYSDPRVCRTFLLCCCPYDVLCNTRMDMGNCPKIHDPALRADFDKAQKERDHFFDIDALEHLERFFDDCDRKNEMSKRRLAETQEELSAECADK
uniref:Uncharacterized protein n=1 Tax=Romanomermis culicivorax TaxID=13658 RepID=A0A915KEB5_ROMCU